MIAAVSIYFLLGSEVTKNLDTYTYELPYLEGTAHRVVQGYGGRFSHTHKAAIDFEMPVGTAIYAAREGIVYAFKDLSDEGGPFSKYNGKANYIIIRHDDGSFGCYWHLRKDGVVIKKGRVEKGQLIGYSGRTGFVLQPHLHFAVKKVLNHEMNSFIRTKFRTEKGIEFLKAGKIYRRPGKP